MRRAIDLASRVIFRCGVSVGVGYGGLGFGNRLLAGTGEARVSVDDRVLETADDIVSKLCNVALDVSEKVFKIRFEVDYGTIMLLCGVAFATGVLIKLLFDDHPGGRSGAGAGNVQGAAVIGENREIPNPE